MNERKIGLWFAGLSIALAIGGAAVGTIAGYTRNADRIAVLELKTTEQGAAIERMDAIQDAQVSVQSKQEASLEALHDMLHHLDAQVSDLWAMKRR